MTSDTVIHRSRCVLNDPGAGTVGRVGSAVALESGYFIFSQRIVVHGTVGLSFSRVLTFRSAGVPILALRTLLLRLTTLAYSAATNLISAGQRNIRRRNG